MTDQQDDTLKQIVRLLDERLPRSWQARLELPDLTKIVSTLNRMETELQQMSESLRLIREKLAATERTKV